MRKIVSLLLVLALAFAMGSVALAEDVTVTLFHNKVEIDTQLKAFAKLYSDMTDGVTVEIETLGGGADYAGTLAAKQNANQMPTMFVIEGDADYSLWKEYLAPYTGEAWTELTDVAYTADGEVWGFPVSIEGFGLGYNAEILAKAEIDPATLTTYTALEAAFQKLDGMKEELGLTCVVATGVSVSGGLWWTAANHNFSVYLGSGLEYGDTSVVDKFNAGELDEERFMKYAKYFKLLCDYSDYDLLTNGNYDNQLATFAEGKAAFLPQGNWVDPSLAQLGVEFEYSFIGHPMDDDQEYTGLYLFAPSYYVLNGSASEAEQQAAKDFLNFMVTSEEGADYMVNQAGMVPAFSNVTLEPAGGFSKALVKANAAGGNYGVYFGKMESGLSQNSLAPIMEMFAQDTSGDAATYLMKDIEDLISKYK